MLKVSLLGTGGTMPLPGRNLTALLCKCKGSMILIDCGEGTQVALKELGWGIKNIDIICLTHYHPDHIVGLPGLLSTLGNSERREKVTIIGPKGLHEIMEAVMVIVPYLPYDIELLEIPSQGLYDFSMGNYSINSVYLEHSVLCVGYSIEVKRGRKFDPDKAKELNIPVEHWNTLQKGGSIVLNGKNVEGNEVLGIERKGIKISYCTDTRPVNKIKELCYKSDLFICEGMYGSDDYLEKALGNKHMLFSEAAEIAKSAEVNEMWLTHFSPSLNEPEGYLNNARDIFKNIEIGKDLMIKELKFM
ncbi:ribonuclease Z [Clostridium sp. KNHs214]|uniref:ribonuclease Z n=1 Tax=Clostridium sp. KNHs214 TaxID=1540257 RepID=UPI000553D567|nr:ribonuclease Z [Clostridium sp. KNHs214]